MPPIPLDWSAVFVETTAVTHVLALVQPSMLLAQNAMFIGPAHLLGLLGDVRVN